MRVGAIFFGLALMAGAGAASAEGDPEVGRELGFTCLGCHGIEGQRNAYPSFRVPRLGGQKSAYLEAALREYRAGNRPHPTMHAQASSNSDQDIADLVAWIGTWGKASPIATAEQVAGLEAGKICVTCHGVAGTAVQPAPPILAGQHAEYLVHALRQYRDNERTGSVMTAFAASLSDSDIQVLAEFYAAQDGLKTLD